LTVFVKFVFKAVAESDDAEVISIKCTLQAAYNLLEGYEPTPEQIEAFKDGNAIFNCWTYFREFVQNAVTRMNYPPPTLPFLRMVPKATTKDSVTGPKELLGPSVSDQASDGAEPSEDEYAEK